MDLTPVERAIVAEQLWEDKLAHTPDEGDPIPGDILQSNMEFMENSNEVVQSCFGTNVGILNFFGKQQNMAEDKFKKFEGSAPIFQ